MGLRFGKDGSGLCVNHFNGAINKMVGDFTLIRGKADVPPAVGARNPGAVDDFYAANACTQRNIC